MNALQARTMGMFKRIPLRYLPFADAASDALPLPRLLRLALLQISIGMATVLLLGTLNRVMIIELNVTASLVAIMVAIPFLVAPFRALIGFKSDVHSSAFGWKRVPYIWIGTMLQFGGLSIMPFALLLLSGDSDASPIIGQVGAALAFLLVGTGLHTTQTAGLALATDLAEPEQRPRVVALMYVVLLIGMVLSSAFFALLLGNFSAVRLIQVVQGAAVVTLVINVIALWKQEARGARPAASAAPVRFGAAWKAFAGKQHARRFMVATGLGTFAFNMQDIILEPYGAEVLGLSVGGTTLLTALLSSGSLIAFSLAAFALNRKLHPCRLAAFGALAGIFAFSMVIFGGALASPSLFKVGVFLIGFGGGLFAVSTLTAAMAMETGGFTGLALGAWGAVQASAAGLAIATGGILRDTIAYIGSTGKLGASFLAPASAYSFVYHLEILFLFAAIVALGPLVGLTLRTGETLSASGMKLDQLPA